jgi:hypothetical protein
MSTSFEAHHYAVSPTSYYLIPLRSKYPLDFYIHNTVLTAASQNYWSPLSLILHSTLFPNTYTLSLCSAHNVRDTFRSVFFPILLI